MTSDQEGNPASFYASPQEARQATAEEFLYLACLHEGTGVESPDFLAVPRAPPVARHGTMGCCAKP